MDEPARLSWSRTYFALSHTSVASKNPPGDKIILPQSALEQLLAAAPSRQPSGATFTSFDPLNPHSNSRHENGQQLPHPLTFRLVNPVNNKAVYAGIREFSAPEGTLGLSAFLSEALGIDLKDTHGTLPKGTYVRLRPLEAGYNPDDWKSLLERHLRDNFTCLTKNAVLSVPGVQGEKFNFLVDKLSPEGDGICVVDTDLEVDIEALNEEQARETMRQIMSKAQSASANGTSEGGELDIWKHVQGQVSPGGYVDYLLPSWNRSQPVAITLSDMSRQDSLDIFVTPRSSRHRALPRDSTHVFGSFGTADRGFKHVFIPPANVELDGADGLLVSVHAHRPDDATEQPSEPITYKLRAKAASTHNPGDGTTKADSEGHDTDDVQCSNCLQWVPRRTMVLHESFCRRNNVVCAQCKSVFKKGSADWEAHWHCDYDDAHGDSASSRARHDDVFHRERSCPSCEFSTNSLPDLARHRTTVCPGDPFNPSPEVVLSGMTAHELADGARTTECHLCDKIVRLRDMDTHLKHHELDKVNRSKPTICRNANCGRTLHGVGPRGQMGAGTAQGQGPGNEIGLCSLCFGPLYVSMHDPEGRALRRRIERRYLGQMMTGCGKSHCVNEWCKTGRANAGLESKGSSAQAILPLVKPLLEKVPEPDKPMFFCVDEANQQRRNLAIMMAAEKGWDLEWCVAAAEAEKGRVEKMREWLQAWAPRR
ncbi:ubiquitin fusion degradation protein UFD1 domain-containing protein [Hirsutella rhossiliensis]|uniref:Ubiquitin fusion degradation protein UFD1 domain-containing protein n=1 Tax=Hirsutella rhossiliensis TaxID=111463 RepID=A0A9P8MW28_9HYPO|nr:ubiquitin fusion degradation protein UFD1 domain-containing protein [Hirsutella rhossiliensis]KAH0961454.1 ubiquitin fusion degradation protein UFD1 domain-containing protein [Hirsutella rhossiliensis]